MSGGLRLHTVLLLPLLVGLGIADTVLPRNLRVDAVDARFLLKWDWDYEQEPNVTFSVDNCFPTSKNWKKMEGCENITATECNVSGIDRHATNEFRVSVYNSRTGERNANVKEFRPSEETVIGPPTGLNMTLHNNALHILVLEPEAFKLDILKSWCEWIYQLEIWEKSTPSKVSSKKENTSHFNIEGLEASTTYCAKARVQCSNRNRTGLYSEPYCITTDPASYVKELVIGLVFVGIIVMSIVLYVCLCPLKRYMKHIFFPKSKLPSSIEKCLQDSPQFYVKNPFLAHEEETTDKCYIIDSSTGGSTAHVDQPASDARNQDSGNYSYEDEGTAESGAAKL